MVGIGVVMLLQKITILILKNVYRLFLHFKYTKTMPGIPVQLYWETNRLLVEEYRI